MIILIKNQKVEVSVKDLPIVITHNDKTYYIKFSSKKNGIFINTREPNDQ